VGSGGHSGWGPVLPFLASSASGFFKAQLIACEPSFTRATHPIPVCEILTGCFY